MKDFLNGKKTYILAALGLVVIGLHAFQVIDVNTANAALQVLGFGSILTLRSAIK